MAHNFAFPPPPHPMPQAQPAQPRPTDGAGQQPGSSTNTGTGIPPPPPMFQPFMPMGFMVCLMASDLREISFLASNYAIAVCFPTTSDFYWFDG